MNSNLSRVLVATCALIALATGIWVANEKRQTAQLLAATKFELPDLDGEMRTLNDWQGKLRIVNFWATWCAPCREEIPLFNAVQQVFGGQGLQIIGVAVDDLDIASSFAEQIGMTFPSLVAGRYGMELLEPFEARGLPFSFVLNENGEIIDTKTGKYAKDELESFLQRHL